MPQINGLQRELGARAQIVAVAIKNPKVKGPKGFETAAAATKRLRLTIPTIQFKNVSQLQRGTPNQWQIAATPTVFIINSAGVIVSVLQPDDAGEVTVPEIRGVLARTS